MEQDDTCPCTQCSCIPCPPPHFADCKESASSILQSIALIEAALSHILNAEGEKIQKTLCITDNACEIMQINESVNQTITSITFLEQVLYSKLKIAQQLCGQHCCHKPDKKTCDCES